MAIYECGNVWRVVRSVGGLPKQEYLRSHAKALAADKRLAREQSAAKRQLVEQAKPTGRAGVATSVRGIRDDRERKMFQVFITDADGRRVTKTVRYGGAKSHYLAWVDAVEFYALAKSLTEWSHLLVRYSV